MKVKQISLFLENKSGRLFEVSRILGEKAVNIRALSIADTSDFGILRLIVDAPEKASEILKKEGFTVSETEVIAVEVPDRPGGLAGVLKIFGEKGINIEYMYAFVGASLNNAVVVIRVEEIDRAISLLRESEIHLLTGSEVYKL